MNSVLTYLMLLIPLSPLLAGLWSIGGGGRPRTVVLLSAIVSCLCAGAIAILFATSVDITPISLRLFEWIDVPGRVPLSVTFGLHIDGLTIVMLSTIMLISALAADDLLGSMVGVHSAGQQVQTIRTSAAFSLALFSVAMVVLSTNFLQLFLFWQLGSLSRWLMTGGIAREKAGAVAARNAALVQRISELLFALGIALVWVHFGSLEFATVFATNGRLSALMETNPAAVSFICLCLVGGCVGRCGLFPAFGWLDDSSHTPIAYSTLAETAFLMPTGVYLIARCATWFAVCPEARLTLILIGVLTVLFTSLIALCDRELKAAMSFTSAGYYGLMFVGLGLGTKLGLSAALLLWVTHSFVKVAGLFAVGEETASADSGIDLLDTPANRRPLFISGRSMLVGLCVLTCGLWGQNAILNGLWEAADQARSTAATLGDRSVTSPGMILRGLFWLTVTALLVQSLALFRVYFLSISQPQARPDQISHDDRGFSGLLNWACVGLAVAAGLLTLEPVSLFDHLLGTATVSDRSSQNVRPFTMGVGLPAAAVGAVIAWMLYSRPSPLARQLAELSGPLYRLCAQRFSLGEAFSLLVLLPIRGTAQLLRFFDWFVLDNVLIGMLPKIPAIVEKLAKPLRNTSAEFATMSLVLAAAVLFATVMWLNLGSVPIESF